MRPLTLAARSRRSLGSSRSPRLPTPTRVHSSRGLVSLRLENEHVSLSLDDSSLPLFAHRPPHKSPTSRKKLKLPPRSIQGWLKRSRSEMPSRRRGRSGSRIRRRCALLRPSLASAFALHLAYSASPSQSSDKVRTRILVRVPRREDQGARVAPDEGHGRQGIRQATALGPSEGSPRAAGEEEDPRRKVRIQDGDAGPRRGEDGRRDRCYYRR